jgi:aminoglycoside 3-N-acetyltransferase I
LKKIPIRTKRLSLDDRELARRTFRLMAEVFEEDSASLSDRYLDQLLSRKDFWAFAALLGSEVVGGITAHTLPMTRTETSEVFIYDIAVHVDHQRRGIGGELVSALRAGAAALGIHDIFVPADNDDTHALDFYRSLGGEPSPVTFFTFSETN